MPFAARVANPAVAALRATAAHSAYIRRGELSVAARASNANAAAGAAAAITAWGVRRNVASDARRTIAAVRTPITNRANPRLFNSIRTLRTFNSAHNVPPLLR